MSNENERRLILEMIDSGKISAEDGLRLLQVLPIDELDEGEAAGESFQPEGDLPPSFAAGQTEPSSGAVPPMLEAAETAEEEYQTAEGQAASGQAATATPDFNRWRRYWAIPLWIGVGITIGGSLLMFWAAQTAGVGFWFICAGIPFALGILILVLAWQSRTARWLHLRVQQKPGEWPSTIAFSFPLPLRISSWLMRTFHRYIPGMEDVAIEEMLATLEHSTSPENPLYIEVEEDNGERVQIYIG